MRLFVKKVLNSTHFERVATHFVGASEHLGVDQELVGEAAEVIGSLRPVFEQAAVDYGKKRAAE
jgi:hypothetical protein